MARKVIDKNGIIYYYNDQNQLHREDGPAVDTIASVHYNKLWYINGTFHRKDGPAIEYSNGDREWFLNDLRHRMDGPAVEWFAHNKFWWYIDGEEYSEQEYWSIINQLNREEQQNKCSCDIMIVMNRGCQCGGK